LAHDLCDQAAKGYDPGSRVAAPEELGAPQIPGGKVGERTSALILMFHVHRLSGTGRLGGVPAQAGLNGCLLIRADHIVVGPEPLSCLEALIQVQDSSRFRFEVGIARKDPASVVPGPNRIFVEPPPDGGPADRSHDPSAHHLPASSHVL